jgi:hypothetical protein
MVWINTQKQIDDFNESEEIQDQFKSLYMYLLYVCGGDFSSFDNLELLEGMDTTLIEL